MLNRISEFVVWGSSKGGLLFFIHLRLCYQSFFYIWIKQNRICLKL